MPNPTRDEITQAAEHCVKGDCTGCPFEQEKGNPCDTWFARALLSAFEREEKMLEALNAARDEMEQVPFAALSHNSTASASFEETIDILDAAIKADEEGV